MTVSTQLSRDTLLDAYRLMRTIREFEERLHVEFATGEIPGFVHLYAGEEASAAGACCTSASRTTSPPPTAATATASPRASTCTG
jgi:TPP-dependent pyruvate/acetoin dehydrogenase alpha subunit